MKYNYLLLALIFSFLTTSTSAQDFGRIFFEAEAVSKISIGEAKREQLNYEQNFSLDVPRISTFEDPVYGLNFSLHYKLNPHFSAGLGSGINFVFEERPDFQDEYHNKILLPFFARLRYQTDINSRLLFLSDLNAGYQYLDFRHGSTENGYLFQESGGLLLNLDLGIGLNLARFTPIFKLGYELNQTSHTDSLRWNTDYSYSDKVEYTTYYHFLKFSLSLKL